MDTMNRLRLIYEPPVTLVFEVELEGVVCASPNFNTNPHFNKPFNDEEDW